MSNWFSGDVIANGIRIHYDRTGGDKPPVVLSHGATDSGLCWIRLARALEADYDVILPDARGHGLSEAPETGYGNEERAADLNGFIQALKLDRPAIGGHSMGAGTSFYAAAVYPDLARCVILEDPGWWAAAALPTDAERASRSARMRSSMTERKAMTREAIIAVGQKESPTWADEEFGPWADAKLRVSMNFAGAFRGVDRLTWQEALPKITAPTLLITSDPEKGGIVTPDVAAEARRLLPSLKVVRLQGAGHNIRREQFDGFLASVRDFLGENFKATR